MDTSYSTRSDCAFSSSKAAASGLAAAMGAHQPGVFACALHCCQLTPNQVYSSVLAGCLKNPQLPRVFSEASFSNVFLICGPVWHALSCPR